MEDNEIVVETHQPKQNEEAGYNGELKFIELLNSNEIPYLYLGQQPLGFDKSPALFGSKAKAKRADFLVSIKGFGSIFFDVKCYSKKKNNDISYFVISSEEVVKLVRLQRLFGIPVWLAFMDRNKQSEENTMFYFISNSVISQLLLNIEEIIDKQDFIRVPVDLYTKVEKNNFEVIYKTVEPTLLDKCINLNLELREFLEEEIKALIRQKEVFKTKLSEELHQKATIKDSYYKSETERLLSKLIEENVVKFTKGKPLKIVNFQ